LNGQDAISDII